MPEGSIDADPDRAVCRDAEGDLYVRIEAPGVYGQARVEVGPDGNETVSFRLSFDDEIPLDAERLLWRLQSAGSDRLAEQLASERTDRGTHPVVNGEDAFQATYVLDPQGIGVVYPFAMAYATPRHVVVVYKGATANHVPPR